MIVARDIALGYRGHGVLQSVTLEVNDAELIALIGPNGCGKSTLLRALAGRHRIEHGVITVNGHAISQLSARERGQTVALVDAEAPPPEGMSVAEVVAGGRLPYRPWWRWSATSADVRAVDTALERTEIAALRHRPFLQLSSGERQRVWLALALAQETHALLLDEPTSHLDIRHTVELLTLLGRLVQGGQAAVVVLHDLNLAAAFAHRIAVLGEHTLLACDTPERVFNEELLARVYGIPIAVRRDASGAVFAMPQTPHLARG